MSPEIIVIYNIISYLQPLPLVSAKSNTTDEVVNSVQFLVMQEQLLYDKQTPAYTLIIYLSLN